MSALLSVHRETSFGALTRYEFAAKTDSQQLPTFKEQGGWDNEEKSQTMLWSLFG
jgi:hypothetical protein